VQEGNNACMLKLVSAGVGVALVPDTFQRLLAIEVEFRPLAPNPSQLEFHIAWHRDNQSPSVQAFLKILREQVQAELGTTDRTPETAVPDKLKRPTGGNMSYGGKKAVRS
jgi:hypothetical protein